MCIIFLFTMTINVSFSIPSDGGFVVKLKNKVFVFFVFRFCFLFFCWFFLHHFLYTKHHITMLVLKRRSLGYTQSIFKLSKKVLRTVLVLKIEYHSMATYLYSMIYSTLIFKLILKHFCLEMIHIMTKLTQTFLRKFTFFIKQEHRF